MITEKEYTQKTSLAHRKKYAQFFTPCQIADFMAQWILGKRRTSVSILEPAFGLGIFTRSLSKLCNGIKVTGYELDTTIYNYASDNFADSQIALTVHNGNYLTQSWGTRYDGIVCNPPYLKFHDYDNATLVPLVNDELGIRLNGFTNLYTLFLLKSLNELNEGGRLAYIIPSEFLNADYGVEVKRALLESKCLRHIIIVDFNQCAFDDTLTTACILLCEKAAKPAKVRFSKTNDIDGLCSALAEYKEFDSSLLDPGVKWKRYYEKTETSKYRGLVPFSTFAKVSRGIATGANDYFTFKPSKTRHFNIPPNCFRQCICHATDVRGLIFTEDDFRQLAAADKAVYLFDGNCNETEQNVGEYIRLGVEQGIDKRYLTANRKPWYALENRRPSPIWVSVFNRQGLRFVRNISGAYNLTTFHCVYDKGVIDTDILFAYLVTDMAKEIFLDNSRQYGNGLIKFEPNDLNKGYIADLRLLSHDEKLFLGKAYNVLRQKGSDPAGCIGLIDSFFRSKYTGHPTDTMHFMALLNVLSCPNDAADDKRNSTKSLHHHQGKATRYAAVPASERCMVCEGRNEPTGI